MSYYEELYSTGFSWKNPEIAEIDQNQVFRSFVGVMESLESLYPDATENISEYLNYVEENPPTLMDSDWKILVILYRYLNLKAFSVEFEQIQDNICSCISQNKSVDLLMFTFKFMYNLIFTYGEDKEGKAINNSGKLMNECLANLPKFKPIKKVPVYDEHLVKPDDDPNILKTP